MTGYFLVGMHDNGKHYTFMHLDKSEFEYGPNGLVLTAGGRLSRFSQFAQRFVVDLPKFPSRGFKTPSTNHGSPFACDPEYFHERLKFIDCHASGKWSISVHPNLKTDCPPFSFSFDLEEDANAFKERYGNFITAKVLQFPIRVG